MPDRIFLVHGMGLYQGTWWDSWVEGIQELYAAYPRLAKIAFERRFKVVPIGYDDVFRDIVDRWQADAGSIGAVAPGVDAGQIDRMVGWLRSAGKIDANFGWTHCSDVLLYYLFPAVRSAVRVHVAKQIAHEVADVAADESWSVLAHSLGTAVTHDALHMLWAGRYDDGTPTGFEPAAGKKANLVAMIANVSRVLESTPDVYESLVKPGPASSTDRGCFYYVNARHRLDPFTIPRAFHPWNWPDPDAVERQLYRDVQVEHILDWNVHDFIHYLKNPDVHVPLFRILTYDAAISQSEWDQARGDFRQRSPLTDAQTIAIKTWLEKQAPAESAVWSAFYDIWEWYSKKGPNT
jgi:hypothetical protein